MKTIGIAVAGLSLATGVLGDGKGQSITTYYHECPHGYELIGKESCTRTVSKPASKKCPDGYSQSGGYHHHFSSYHKDDSSSFTCSKTLSEEPQTICPSSYELSGRKCVMTSEAPREYFCPAGYEHNPEECTKSEYAKFLEFCAKGKMTKDGCVTYNTESPQTVCPGGYKLSGSSCIIYEEAPYKYYCPSDYVKSEQKGTMGDCTKLLTQEVIYSCPDGTIREGNDCATYTGTHPEKSCSAELEEGRCLETSYTDKDAVCSPGFTLSSHTGEDGGILCEKCANVHKQTSRCEYKPATLVCPPGYYKPGADKTQGCIKKTPVPFEYFCPEGYTESDQKGSALKCTKRESVVLNQSCKSGFTLSHSNSCTKMITTPQLKKCPNGYESSPSKGACKKVLKVAPEIVCPASYELRGHSCVEKIVEAVSTKCPYSYEVSGDQCVKVSSVPKSSKCPENFSDSYGKSACKKIETTTPEVICPTEGYELQTGSFRHATCTATVTAPAEYFCTKGYSPAGEECLATESIAPINKQKTEWIPKEKSKGY